MQEEPNVSYMIIQNVLKKDRKCFQYKRVMQLLCQPQYLKKELKKHDYFSQCLKDSNATNYSVD